MTLHSTNGLIDPKKINLINRKKMAAQSGEGMKLKKYIFTLTGGSKAKQFTLSPFPPKQKKKKNRGPTHVAEDYSNQKA